MALSQARDEAPLTSFMKKLQGTENDLNEKQRQEHTLQNMSKILEEVSEDQKESRIGQFKIFQFCTKIKANEYDYDLYQMSSKNFYLPDMK